MKVLDLHEHDGIYLVHSDLFNLGTPTGKVALARVLRKVALDLDPYKAQDGETCVQVSTR